VYQLTFKHFATPELFDARQLLSSSSVQSNQ